MIKQPEKIKEVTVFEFIRDKIKNYHDRVFIKYGKEEFTWLDIEKCSQIIATDLDNLGVRKDSHVGLYGANSINWIFVFFAIRKLGADVVLLNPSLTTSEIENASALADIDFFCCGNMKNNLKPEELVSKLKSNNNNKIKNYYFFDDSISYIERFIEYNIIKDNFLENLHNDQGNVFMFTSGSTGQPKVVMHPAKNLIYRTFRYSEDLELNSNDIHIMVMPLFHCFALCTILFTAAISNAKVIMPQNTNSSTILRTIKDEKCTNFNTVSTMMLALVSNSDFNKDDLQTIRSSVIGGAIASPEKMDLFCDLMPNNTIINSYALTESFPVAWLRYCKGMDDESRKTVGKPYSGVEIAIQNIENGKRCEDGETGEIIVKSYGTMSGYYKLPPSEQTVDENGWLHTGDLGYINKNKELCINGRLKDIIIRSGENIMPLEIASAIEKMDCINDVKVIGVPDDFRGEEIAACVSLNEGYLFDEEIIKKELEKYISKHKIPRYFIVFKDFPKLENGKIDVIKLKQETLKYIN